MPQVRILSSRPKMRLFSKNRRIFYIVFLKQTIGYESDDKQNKLNLLDIKTQYSYDEKNSRYMRTISNSVHGFIFTGFSSRSYIFAPRIASKNGECVDIIN